MRACVSVCGGGGGELFEPILTAKGRLELTCRTDN